MNFSTSILFSFAPLQSVYNKQIAHPYSKKYHCEFHSLYVKKIPKYLFILYVLTYFFLLQQTFSHRYLSASERRGSRKFGRNTTVSKYGKPSVGEDSSVARLARIDEHESVKPARGATVEERFINGGKAKDNAEFKDKGRQKIHVEQMHDVINDDNDKAEEGAEEEEGRNPSLDCDTINHDMCDPSSAKPTPAPDNFPKQSQEQQPAAGGEIHETNEHEEQTENVDDDDDETLADAEFQAEIYKFLIFFNPNTTEEGGGSIWTSYFFLKICRQVTFLSIYHISN